MSPEAGTPPEGRCSARATHRWSTTSGQGHAGPDRYVSGKGPAARAARWRPRGQARPDGHALRARGRGREAETPTKASADSRDRSAVSSWNSRSSAAMQR